MRTPVPLRRLIAAGSVLAALTVIPAVPAAASASGPAARAAPKTVPAVLAWGINNQGQLGNGSTTDSNTPVDVKLPGSQQFTTMRSDLFSLAVSASGRVYTWGFNGSGQLGDGTTTSRLTPERITLPAGVKVKTARAGSDFALALTTGGRMLAWGYNGNGALGTGSTADHHKPAWVKLPRGVRVTAISAGADSSLALTSTGRVLSWGGNNFGELGDGTGADRHRPGYVRLPKHTTIKSIAAGSDTGYAVTSAGRLLAWGFNFYGQLGDGTTQDRTTPVRARLPRGVTVVAAAAGHIHALALTTGHKVLAWGYNSLGQLGTGSTASHHKPVWVKLPAGTKAAALTAGEFFSMVLTSRHRILAWGENIDGELGNGTNTDSHLPVRVHLPPGFTPTVIGAGWRAESAMAAGRQVPN